MNNGKIRKFSNNVCESIPKHRRRKVKTSCTLDAEIEEKVFVFAEFCEGVSFSALVDSILHEYFQDPAVEKRLREGYRKWSNQNP